MKLKRHLGPLMSLLAIGGFVLASFWAKWNPVQAQGAAAKKNPEGKSTPKVATPVKQKNVPAAKVNSAVPFAGHKLDPTALAKFIDDQVAKVLVAEKIPISSKADDAEFLRRVYLDLVGVIPPPDKVKAFLDSKDADKRAKVIDELLADPRFGIRLAEIWSSLMIPVDSNNRRLNSAPLQKWLAARFNDNQPLDKLVHDLVTATGSQDENGAATYFVANASVDKITGNVSRLFLGVQLQCAQCHNHPFTDWKQTEYWGMAAFFMNVRISANPQKAAKKGTPITVTEGGGGGPRKKGGGLPEGAKLVPAKYLGGAEAKVSKSGPMRPALADWMTSHENPFFARALVNRFWHHLFGRGLVNPVDDMHDENGPTHPDLLAAMTEQFKNNGFDLKYMLRAICNSQTYQRTSRPTGDNKLDSEYYSHRLIRALSPEQLYDSLIAVVGKPTGGPGGRGAFAGKKGPAITGRDGFINFFRVDEANPVEYQVGIPQALRLMNSSMLNNLSAPVSQALKAGNGEPDGVLNNLYLVALSRRPTAEEIQRYAEYVRRQPSAQAAYSDILWALLNSSEFALNR